MERVKTSAWAHTGETTLISLPACIQEAAPVTKIIIFIKKLTYYLS